MIKDILEPENLAAAWKRVKANKGAPGIDGMTVGDFPAFARVHWPRIASAIMDGTYRPAPVKRAWIPKPDGSKRPLGIALNNSWLEEQGVPDMKAVWTVLHYGPKARV
jgi:RNA-directed DNA polymerase